MGDFVASQCLWISCYCLFLLGLKITMGKHHYYRGKGLSAVLLLLLLAGHGNDYLYKHLLIFHSRWPRPLPIISILSREPRSPAASFLSPNIVSRPHIATAASSFSSITRNNPRNRSQRRDIGRLLRLKHVSAVRYGRPVVVHRVFATTTFTNADSRSAYLFFLYTPLLLAPLFPTLIIGAAFR
jgi:hypothetical protein